MDSTVKKDILSVLNQTIVLIDKKDFASLKELSNHVNHNASIYQDHDSIQAAVVVYALSKILERETYEGKKISFDIKKSLETAINYLEKDNEDDFHDELRNLLTNISQSDEKLLMYVQNVIEKAHIAKGSDIYGHGISLARTAEMLGINQWDLMSFIGKTRIADKEEMPSDVTKRLSFAKKLFKTP